MFAIKELYNFIDKGLTNLDLKLQPEELYQPIEYMISIGGKRLRPALCLITYNLFSDRIEKSILHPALALEVFHCFTLIHDDIMDKADIRRGQPTVYKKWNNNIAILSGDVMSIKAYELLANAPKDALPEALGLFSKTAAQVCEGQQYDMNFENIPYITMDDYISMISLKTAVLIACAAKLGAIIAGANEKTAKILYNYAFDLGIAFQIQDDLFDTFGESNIFGKKIGGDILNNKKTWLLVESYRVCNSQQRAEIDAIIAMPTEKGEEKISAMRELYIKLGVKDSAEKTINDYYNKALKEINDNNFTSQQIEQLNKFAEMLIKRIK